MLLQSFGLRPGQRNPYVKLRLSAPSATRCGKAEARWAGNSCQRSPTQKRHRQAGCRRVHALQDCGTAALGPYMSQLKFIIAAGASTKLGATMPNRTTTDEREKLDHSAHPMTHATKDDLRAPGGGANPGGKMTQDAESELDPPSDDSDRIKDFFSRHGGPGTASRRFGRSQGGLQGWSEIVAHDGHVLRCDWSRSGTREEMKFSEVAPPRTA